MNQRTFLELLAVLASQCGRVLVKTEISLYERAFATTVGWTAACQTLEKCLVDRTAKDPMPSVGDLRRMCGVGQELTIEEQSDGIVAKIISSISRRGYYWFHEKDWPAPAVNDLGEWGYRVVVEWGGWQRLVEDSGEVELGTLRAQLRRLAVNIGLRAKAGSLAPPALPKPATSAIGHASGPTTGLAPLAMPRLSGQG